MHSAYRRLLSWWAQYERIISGVSLVVGFVFDLFVAKRPDSVPDNLLLLAYLVIAALSITAINRRALRAKETEAEPLLILLILQFCFGGLASNLLVLYGHSGTLSGTALFLGVLGGMLVGNEFLRNRYAALRFNLAVYTLLLLTYLAIAVPTFLTHRIGTLPFLLSSILGGAVMALFIFFLSGSARLFRGKLGERRLIESSIIVVAVVLVFNGLYFAHLMPPVPLSLKAAGVYHSIVKTPVGYRAELEAAPWWMFWADTSSTYHASVGSPAYCFSAIFAPTGLTTPIVHRWQWYDAHAGAWKQEAAVTFPITGGRAEGYYGYSIKSLTNAGAWRCDVTTENGALIGRVQFTAVPGTPPALETRPL